MKRLALASIFLIPSYVFADRLGSLKPNSQVALSTQAIQNVEATGIHQTPATIGIDSGTIYGPFTIGATQNPRLYLDQQSFGIPNSLITFSEFGTDKVYLLRDQTGFNINVATIPTGSPLQRIYFSDQGSSLTSILDSTVGIRGVNYVWPSANVAGSLTNSGTGSLSWASSGGVTSSSTSWIQNTLTPTTTTQVFSVSTGTMFSAVISSQITSPGPLFQSEHYGAFSQANSSGATVIGANAVIAELGNSIENTVIGANSKIISSVQGSPSGRSTVVGADSTCDGHNATAVGAAQTVSANGVGVGYGNTVGNAGTAVGISLTVGGNAVAMGLVANAGATNSIALARAADASGGGVAIGYQSKTSAPGDVALASRTNGSVGGTKIRLQGNSSTTSQQTLAQITSAWADSTHATRKSQLDLLNTDFNGDKTFLRGEADGTTSVVGVGIASSTTNVKLSVFIDSNTYAGLVVKSTASQTANPIEVWDSNNVVKSSITSAGVYWSGGKRVCLEDGTNCTASGGGVSGVGPPVAVGTGTASNFTNNVTSPTAAISFEGTQFKSSALGTTNYIVIDTMSSTGLMVISSMTNYMTQSSATANDLTLSSAAATYQYKGNYLTSVSGFGPSVAVGTGTSSNFTTSVTSPTMAIDLEGADFTSTALGTTNYVKLNNTGVAAGSYTNPTITFDAKGRATSATSVAASTGTNAIFSSTMDFKDLNSTAISTITSSFGVGSLTLAANFFTQGQSVDFYAVGYSSSAGNSATTLRIRVSLGTATVMDSGAVTINAGLANLSNTFFRIDGNMACRTTGTSGTAIGQVTWRHNLGASSPGGVSGAVAEMFPATTATTTFDTTAQQIFNVSFQWNTAATTNGLVITNYVVSKN